MSDAIQQIGSKIAEQSVSQKQTTEVQPPDEEAVAKFEKAMEEEQPSASQNSHVGAEAQTVSQVEEVSSHSEVSAPGDQILQGIEKLRQNHEAQIEKVNKLLESKGKESLSVQEALRLQFELVQLNFQQDLVSKGADKSSQAVQTVFRNQ